MMTQLHALFVFSALLVSTSAHAAATEVTLAKLSVAPDEFDGQVVQTDVSMAMVAAQKALSQCKGKDKAIMVMPKMEAAAGAPVATMGAMGTVAYQVCLPVSKALELADLPTGQPLRVTGTVKTKRQMGILFAIVFEDAEVVKLEGAASGVLSAPTAAPAPAEATPSEATPDATPAAE